MFTFVADQSLSNSDMHKYWCLKNIKELYKSSWKCDDQLQYKSIIEAAIVCTTEGLTDNIPIALVMPGTLKNPIVRKFLRQFRNYWI